MSITRDLFRLARLAADVEAVMAGPEPTANRAKNKAVGRSLGPLWRVLWGRWW